MAEAAEEEIEKEEEEQEECPKCPQKAAAFFSPGLITGLFC